MKKRDTLALIVLIAIAMIIPQTLAATSQGLFYRPDDGDRFYFSMEFTSEGATGFSEIVYVEIENSSKPIPDPLTDLADLEHLDKGFYFENGTDMGSHSLVFQYLARFEFPVGDWDLILTLAGTDLASLLIPSTYGILVFSEVVFSEVDSWGYTYYFNNSIDTEFGISAFYSKFDGSLNHYIVQNVNTTTHELISLYEITRILQHNMIWGFNAWDRFDFNLTVTGNALSFHNVSEQFYIEVAEDGLEVIPYSLTDFDDIPFFGADVYWMNGTEIYTPFLSHSWKLAVLLPGNWSLLDDLIAAKSSSVNVTADDYNVTFWGYSWCDMTDDILIEVHTDYLKADGFLAHHTASFTNTTSSEVIGTLSVTRIGLPEYQTPIPVTWFTDNEIQDFIMDNLLYIGIGVVVILGLVVFIRKR